MRGGSEPMTSFLHELKRRRVVRVAVVYVAGAFAALQAADILVPALHLPASTMTVLVVLLALGLLLAIALAWVYEVTADGIRVTSAAAAADDAHAAIPALLGRRTLIVAGLLVLAGSAFGAGWVLGPDGDAGEQGVVSVAVLPFADLSDDRSQEYFGDGLAEELLNLLVRADDIEVASRTSSFAYKGRALPLREIAGELGVNHVIDGSVRKAGNRLRISAQLIDVRSDRQLWAESFDRELDDVFRIQTEIAAAVSSALRIRLSGDARKRFGTADAAAYDLYLLGLYHWNRRTPEGLQRAIEIFTEATQRDPGFARAWAGLSFAWKVLPQYAGYDDDRALREARAAAEEAIRLDPGSVESRTAIGGVLMDEGAPTAALREFDRALVIDAAFPTTHHWRGITLITLGDVAGGEAALRQALRLDPSSLPAQSFLALSLDMQGRTADALAEVQSLLARSPDYRNGLIDAFILGAQLGRAREFEPQLRSWLRTVGEDPALSAVIVAGVEDPDQRQRAIAAVEGMARNHLGLFALLQAREQTLRVLEQGPAPIPLLGMTRFDFLREDPRFSTVTAGPPLPRDRSR